MRTFSTKTLAIVLILLIASCVQANDFDDPVKAYEYGCLAVIKGSVSRLKKLKKSGYDFDRPAYDNQPSITAYALTAYWCDKKVIEYLVGRRPNRTIIANGYRGSLIELAACFAKCPEVITLLVKCGADINHISEGGLSVLSCALHINSGNPEIIKALVDAGANPNLPEAKRGRTPLFYAAYLNDAKTAIKRIKVLLKCGADLSRRDKYGFDTICYTAKHSERDTVQKLKFLLEKGALLNPADSRKKSPPLQETVHNDNIRESYLGTKFLIEQGAEIEARNRYDATALISACYIGNVVAANLLLEKGANIYAKQIGRCAPACLAFERNNPALFVTLLKNGLDPDKPCKGKLTPRQWAAKHKLSKQYLKYLEIYDKAKKTAIEAKETDEEEEEVCTPLQVGLDLFLDDIAKAAGRKAGIKIAKESAGKITESEAKK